MNQKYRCDLFNDNIVASHDFTKKAFTSEFHLHNGYEIYFFLNGDVNYFVEQSCYKLQKGNLLIFNNKEIHKAVNLSDSSYERIVIHFKPELLQHICTEKTNLLDCFENRETGVNNIALLDVNRSNFFISTAKQLIHHLETDSYGSDLLSLSNVIQLLVMVNETFSNKNQYITSIISPKILPVLQYIDLNLTENLSLDYLSNKLTISKYYLSHLFKENTGSTVYQYILLKRIALAKQLLLGGMNVTEACQQAGFTDYSNFIRTFKNATGISPGNFVNRNH